MRRVLIIYDAKIAEDLWNNLQDQQKLFFTKKMRFKTGGVNYIYDTH